MDNDDYFSKMTECIDTLQGITTGLLDAYTKVSDDNKALRIELNDLKSNVNDLNKKPSFAGTVTQRGAALSVSTNQPPVSQTDNGASSSDSYLTDRLDKLEQESLRQTLLFQGPVVNRAIDGEADKKKISEKVVDIVNSFNVNNITMDHIVSVSLMGREVKMVKVCFSSLNSAKQILLSAKREKPNNVFVTEFLTKYRSTLFFKLRQLKKKFSVITAAYIREGNIYYKLDSSTRPVRVFNEDNLKEIESRWN
jgi:hypothetical protein